LEAARAAATERRKEVIPKIRRVPAAMQAEGDGARYRKAGFRR